MPDQFTDDQRVIAELEALGADVTYEPWDAAGIDWRSFDAVGVRSPWDYSYRRDEFVAWAEAAGPSIHNSADLLRWNSEKSYVSDLAKAGLSVVETLFLEPGQEWPGDEREVVVKPSVSAGGRDTGRFGPALEAEARRLIKAIHGSGRVAMVQPFQASVDEAGETALVFIDGEFSHPLRKKSVLRPDEVAPVRSTDLQVAEAMYDPELVLSGTYEEDELALAKQIVTHITDRFDYTPLYARVDMLRGADGAPMLLELEAVEPNLYFDQYPDGAGKLARALVARAG